MVHVDIYMRGIGGSIWNAGSEQAVLAFFVIDNYGPVCVGDEKECWGGGDPTNGCADGGGDGTLGFGCQMYLQ
jgi:hypothetical protein